MDHFNAIRGTVTVGGTGNLTVSTTGAGKGRPLSTIPVGTGIALRFDDPNGVDWELSLCTMLTATTLSRDTLLCSSTGSKVNLGAGTIALETVVAEQLNAMLSVADIPFSAAIPLTRVGNSYMAAKTITAALTLTPAASAVRGALVYLRVIADGVNLPNYSAFKEWGGSMGYDNRNGIENQMQFFYDGSNYWVSISQAAGAVGVASVVTLSGSASGTVGTATTYTVGTTPAGGTVTGTLTVTPTPVTGVTFSPTSVSLTTGTTATFTATATTAGTYAIAVTNNGGLTNAGAISYVAAAPATAPGAPTALSASSSGETTVNVTFTAPASNGGSAITGYAVTSSPAGGVDSNAGGTGLTHAMTGLTTGTAYTFTATATNAVGTSSASAVSNSATPQPVAPGAPSLVATGGDSFASIAITAGSGGTPTGYTVTSSPAGGVESNAGNTTSPRTITGLTNGTAYTFTATATNTTGTSVASAASNSVTPSVVVVYPRVGLLSGMTESGTGPYAYTGGAGVYSTSTPGPGGVLTTHLADGAAGSMSFVKGARSGASNSGSDPILGFTKVSTLVAYTAIDYGIFGDGGTNYKPITTGTIGTPSGSTIVTATGDVIRIRREISAGVATIYAEVAVAATPTAFTTVNTWNNAYTGPLYVQVMAAKVLPISGLANVGMA